MFVLFAVVGAMLPNDSGLEATPAADQQAAGAGDDLTVADAGGAAETPTGTATSTATPDDGPDQTPTPTLTPESDQTVHAVGESFSVGSGEKAIQYTVTSVSTASQVGGDYGEEADGTFVLVELAMENMGDKSLDISSRPFTVVDSQDREYEADTNAMIYAEDSVIFEQLNLGLTKQGIVVFDVPADGTYRLRIAPAGMVSTAEVHTVELEVSV